jgi:hypothetical protein
MDAEQLYQAFVDLANENGFYLSSHADELLASAARSCVDYDNFESGKCEEAEVAKLRWEADEEVVQKVLAKLQHLLSEKESQ